MSERSRRPGTDLPADDDPSPDVLDELLRAFAVDPDAAERHGEIDLTSPEVAELLTPSGGTPGPEDDDDATEAVTAVTASPAADDAEDEPDDEPDDETADETAGGGDDETDDGGEPAGVAGDPFLRPAASAPDDESADPAGAGAPSTISIVDEGLPDTVYIGGNLEPTDVSRSTVVIDDRDGGDATISLEAATSATKIEPRMRERRIAVKRAQGRKRLKWALIATAVILLAVAALATLGSGLFAVDEVTIEGAEHTTSEELAPIVASLEGEPVLRVDTDEAERVLRQLPWVEDARVTTQFPDGATIELRERTPAAAYQGPDGAWRLIDDTGRVLALSAEAPAGYLPIVGEDFPDVEPGVFAPPGLKGAAQLARSLTPTVLARTAEIRVTTDGSDLRLTFSDGIEVRFGPAEDLVAKLVRLETKLDDVGDEPYTYLDVSTNEVGQG